MRFTAGEEINIVYSGYTVRGRVVDHDRRGCVTYETISCSRDGERYAGMEVEAAEEFCYRDGEPTPSDPLLALWTSMTGLKA